MRQDRMYNTAVIRCRIIEGSCRHHFLEDLHPEIDMMEQLAITGLDPYTISSRLIRLDLPCIVIQGGQEVLVEWNNVVQIQRCTGLQANLNDLGCVLDQPMDDVMVRKRPTAGRHGEKRRIVALQESHTPFTGNLAIKRGSLLGHPIKEGSPGFCFRV